LHSVPRLVWCRSRDCRSIRRRQSIERFPMAVRQEATRADLCSATTVRAVGRCLILIRPPVVKRRTSFVRPVGSAPVMTEREGVFNQGDALPGVRAHDAKASSKDSILGSSFRHLVRAPPCRARVGRQAHPLSSVTTSRNGLDRRLACERA
jgi:hypothetical protein